LAKNLDARTTEDTPPLFTDSDQNLTGIAVDITKNVFVADSKNRRLLKIDAAGKVSVLLRTDPPFFPNGVFVRSGEIYVLEAGLTLPASWSGPRVRRIRPDGSSTILVTLGAGNQSGGFGPPASYKAGETILTSYSLISGRGLKYGAVILGALIVGTCVIIWKRRKLEQ
jgi:hypothetical protein